MSCDEKCAKSIDKMPLTDFPVAMAYVPWQEWRDICNIDEGFFKGSIFKELQKPFVCYK